MARKSAKNSVFLKAAKEKTSPKVYDLLLKLMRDDREDMAELVMKIDYLLEYTSICIKDRDYNEARETLNKAKSRIDTLKSEGIDTEYLDYLYEGIESKIKK